MNDMTPTRTLVPGRNCRRIELATEASVIIDADDYFRIARRAMLDARKRIVLVGWDFDARITLGPDPAEDEAPARLGELIYWLVRHRPGLEIFLLRWDLGAVKVLTHGSTIFTLMKWMSHPRIHTKLDGVHPTGASHHQKIVVIDECLAFCGGIDMTAERWDTREHRHDDPRRRSPTGRPHKPWHDATTAVTGPMAKALADICRDRWHRAGGRPMPPIPVSGPAPACWPEGLPVQFRDVPMAVSISAPVMPDAPPVREVEELYVDQIAQAKRFVYAESQYFASRRIAEAIARRLEEPNGPEIVIVNPLTAQGWLEPIAMDTARARLHEALHRLDRHGRFRIYHPFDSGGAPIYVHAKVLVVDDRMLRVGSSNMNNRSMRLDTECDITIDAALAPDPDVRRTIVGIRDDLLAEHLTTDAETVAAAVERHGSLIGAIEALRQKPGRTLRPYETPDLTSVATWLADHEVLDPEGPEEMFEPLEKRGLFRRLSRRLRHKHGSASGGKA